MLLVNVYFWQYQNACDYIGYIAFRRRITRIQIFPQRDISAIGEHLSVFFAKFVLRMRRKCYQFLMTKLCQTFMITLWTVNRFESQILRIWNIALQLQWPPTQLAYCQSSKCPLDSTQARRRALHQLRYQLHSVEGHAKCCPTVP